MESPVIRESLAAAVERGERVLAVVLDPDAGVDLARRVENALNHSRTLRRRRIGVSGTFIELDNGGALHVVSVHQQHVGRGMQVDRLVNYTGRALPERVLLALVAAVRP